MLSKVEDWKDPKSILMHIHRVLEPDIGAAMSVAVINNAENKVSLASVGNISSYVIGENDHCFLSHDGAIGMNVRKVSNEVRSLKPGELILLHSDGIQSRLYRQYQKEVMKCDVSQIVDYIFNHFAKKHDDASCLIYRF